MCRNKKQRGLFRRKGRRRIGGAASFVIVILTLLISHGLLGIFISIKPLGADIMQMEVDMGDFENNTGKHENIPPIVVIDAGHGGHDPGGVWGDIYEKDINLDIALLVKEILEEKDFEAIMTRDEDIFIPLKERAMYANNNQGDYFISIHQNISENADANGIEVILDILAKRNIKATFFLMGANVGWYPEIAKRIVDDGHKIGVHCYSHNYEEIYKSSEAYLSDFVKASDMIEAATGIRPEIYRFPGGSINGYNKTVYGDIAENMGEIGYIYHDWNGSLEDSIRSITKEQLLDNVKDTSFMYKRMVLLAHDTIPVTAETPEDILDLFYEY